MTENPKVSIILTSYNHAEYLSESIDSVLRQTFENFELIIWDDASTDSSWQIIERYSDPRIKSIRNDINRRPNYGINKSIREKIALGEYIAIHHSGDIWEPGKLEKQVIFLDSHPQIGAVFTWARIIDENGLPFQDTNHFYYKIFEQLNRTRHEWLNYFFYHGNALCHPSVLIRRSCYDDCGLYRYGFAQIADFDMWVRLCLKYDIHVLPEKLIRFRVLSGEKNISGGHPDARGRGEYELFETYCNYLEIQSKDDLRKIFPDADLYLDSNDTSIDYALARIALDPKTPKPAKLVGLRLLFDALNDPECSKKIEEIYGFSQVDFIALTARYDVFSLAALEHLRSQLEHLRSQLENLKSRIANQKERIKALDAELSRIYQSRRWRFLKFLKNIYSKIIPS
jgi:glycosyltransferase involved in cell wall biosynthesis